MIKYKAIFDKTSCYKTINDLISSAKSSIIFYTNFFDLNNLTLNLMKNILYAANNNVSVKICYTEGIENVFIKQNNLKSKSDYNTYAMHLLNHPLIKVEKTSEYSNYIIVDDFYVLLGFYDFKETNDEVNCIYLEGIEVKKSFNDSLYFKTEKGEGRFIKNNVIDEIIEAIDKAQSRLIVVSKNITNDKVFNAIKKNWKKGLKISVIIKKKNEKIKLFNFITKFKSKKEQVNMQFNCVETKRDFMTNFILYDDNLLYSISNLDYEMLPRMALKLTKIEEEFRQEILNNFIKK